MSRKKLYEFDIDQDIRYLGPLSYRHFRIFGWLCLALSQVAFLFSLVLRFSEELADTYMETEVLLSAIGSLSLPFLLFANFTLILDNTAGYKNRLIFNGGVTGLIILVYSFVVYRYALGIIGVTTGNRASAHDFLNQTLAQDSSTGFYAFNLFIDLFLCTLFMFFLHFRPKRFFTGKKIYLFRLLAILPVVYEISSIVLKFLSIQRKIVLSVFVFPFLTTKPPILFLVFLVLAAFIKTRERRFCKHGRTHQEYMKFLKTRRNSWHFSRFAAIVFFVAGILDAATIAFMIPFLGVSLQSAVADEEVLLQSVQTLQKIGFGNSSLLIPIAPLLLLYSYTRSYKNKILDYLIPVLGMLAIVFVYLEGGYQAFSIFFGGLLK